MVSRRLDIEERLLSKQSIERLLNEFIAFFNGTISDTVIHFASVDDGTHSISYDSLDTFFEALYHVDNCALHIRLKEQDATLGIESSTWGTSITVRASMRQKIDDAIEQFVTKCDFHKRKDQRLTSEAQPEYERHRTYDNYALHADRVSPLLEELNKLALEEAAEDAKYTLLKVVHSNNDTWEYPRVEEFLGNVSSDKDFAIAYRNDRFRIRLDCDNGRVTYSCSSAGRSVVDRIGLIVERYISRMERTRQITIFIGHGRSNQWRDLKDHLQDIHHYTVTAYEIGPRAGLSVKEVLSRMLQESSLGLLVLTGEDEQTDGTIHARENVIHEVGLFQGRMGFERAIILLEEGVKEFSNILGINQISRLLTNRSI